MEKRTKHDIYTLYLRKRRKGVLRMFTIFKEEKVITAGIRCGFKPTSCPDQLAHALEEMIAK